MTPGFIDKYLGRDRLLRGLPVAIAAILLGGLLTTLPSQGDAASRAGGDAATTVTDAMTTSAGEIVVAQAASGSPTGSLDAARRKEIEQVVRGYLLKNPEILLEMQGELERRMEVSRNERMKNALSKNAAKLYRSASTPVAGNPNGDVTVVEFFDYNCGFCRRAISSMAKLIDSDANVKVLFKEFPIFGKESEAASRIAIAARKQGKYWQMHRALLEAPGRAGEAKGLRLAKKLGLDIAKLKTDMNSDEVIAEIKDSQKLAEAMGIRGTPHFFVGDKVIPGAPENLLEQLRERIVDVRKNGCPIC